MSVDPVIISSYEPGVHGLDLEKTVSRLDREAMWRDLPTVMVTPAGDSIPTRVVVSWENIICPPNNRLVRLTAIGVEVGDAYSNCIRGILDHPELSKWKYIVTREWDNIIPPDGLVRLIQSMEQNQEYDAIGGLYFTKGECGVAQIWGDANDPVLNFRPQKPDPNGGLKPCYGIGMGWSAFRVSMFNDARLRRPWFKTLKDKDLGVATQDMYFWTDAFKHGFKCAVDCSIKVGHYDKVSGIVW